MAFILKWGQPQSFLKMPQEDVVTNIAAAIQILNTFMF